jgi:hypothetical protein
VLYNRRDNVTYSRRSLIVSSDFCTLLIVSDDFDLNSHSWKAKLGHADASKDGTVARQPLLEISDGRHN